MTRNFVCRKTQSNVLFWYALVCLCYSVGCGQKKTPIQVEPPDKRSVSFEFRAVGPDFRFRPTITNVQVVDLDGDGKNEILACDVQQNGVFSYSWNGTGWKETRLADNLVAPAHATVVDIDGDNDKDLIVSVMGNLHPDDGVIGSLVLLENQNHRFEKRIILDDVRRVVDAQPGDFDNDGDLDLAVAVFGYSRGEVLWLENLANGTFQDHQLLVAPGTIHVPVADYDLDGDLDIAAIVSQDEEEVWVFENKNDGDFAPHRVFFTVNFDIGSAGLVKTDLDRDGDIDLLLPVGDNLEDKFSYAQPYHGCLWLENQRGLRFSPRRIAHFPGTYAAAVGDIDQDSDNDVVLVSMVNDLDAPQSASVVWLENDGSQTFTQHIVARNPIQLVTVDVGDVNHDGRADIVAGGLHVFRPYDRLGRISSWFGQLTGHTDSESRSPHDPATQHEQATKGLASDDVPLPDLQLLDSITAESFREMRDVVVKRVEQGMDGLQDWLRLGEAFFAFGFYPEAAECLRRSIDRDADSFEGHFLLASCQSRMGQLQQAIRHFQNAKQRATDQLGRQWCDLQIAKAHLRLENTSQAETSLIRAGNLPSALYELAKLRARSDRLGDAMAVFKQLDQQSSSTVEVLLLKARVLSGLGMSDEANQMLDAAEYNSRQLPEDPVVLRIERVRSNIGLQKRIHTAQKSIKANHIQQAIDILDEVNSAGWDQSALLLTAIAELRRAKPRRAISILEKLIANRGLFPQATLLLGDAYLATGNVDKAREIWEATAEMQSGIALHDRLARLYGQNNDLQKQSHQRALRLHAIGIADLRSAKVSLAKDAFQHALQLDKSLVRSWFYLGECYRLSGQLPLAIDAYRRCLDYSPNHGRAHERLERLEAGE